MRRDTTLPPEQPTTEQRPRSVMADVRRATLLGWKTGLIFCAWVIVLIVLNWSFTLQLDDGRTVNAFAAFALYFFGGPITGAIMGLLLPLMKSLPGALFVGYIAAIPAAIGVMLILRGFVWDSESIILTLVTALLGPATVFMVRMSERSMAAQKKR